MFTNEATLNVAPRVSKQAPARVAPEPQAVSGTGRAAEQAAPAPIANSGDNAQAGESRGIDVEESVGKLNEIIQDIRRELKFSVDDASGQTVIKVIDSETQEVVRQIPPEEVLTLVQHLQGMNQSLMMDLEA